jgi:hypothetical protein
MLLSAASAAGLAATANASITYDVEAFGFKRGTATTTFAETKSMTGVQTGDIIKLRVYAVITGTNPAKAQTLQSASGSLLSSNGGLLGNWNTTRVAVGAGTAPHISAPWGGPSSSVGLAQDLDGDTDLDLGSNNDADAANFVAYRSSILEGPHSNHFDANNDTYVSDFVGIQPTTTGASTKYALSAEIDFTVTNGNGSTNLNWRLRNASTAATWFEDADETTSVGQDTNGSTAFTYSGGTAGSQQLVAPPVILQGTGGTVPEPASLGLIGLVGLGALARRRNA